MIRLRNLLPLVAAAVVGAAMLGAPNRAHADFVINIVDSSTGAGGVDVFFAAGSGDQAGSFSGLSPNGEFLVLVTAGIVTQSATQTELDVSALRVQRTSLLGGTLASLSIRIGGNNLSLPPSTPLEWTSGAGGSYTPISGGTGFAAMTFQSFGDSTNLLLGAQQTLGLQTPSPPSSTSPQTFDTGDVQGLFNRTGTDFSLRSDSNITLSGNGSLLGFQGHNILRPVPAPASLILLLSGLPVLGAGQWIRRRTRSKVAA